MQICKEITDMTNYKYKYSMSKQSCIIKNAMTTKAIGYRVTSGKVRLFFLPTPESLRMRQPLFCLPICVCCNNTLQFTRCFKIESECHPSVYRKCPFIVYAGAIMHLPTFPSKVKRVALAIIIVLCSTALKMSVISQVFLVQLLLVLRFKRFSLVIVS